MTNRNRKIRTKMRIERDRRRRNQVHSSSILREASFLLMFLIILGLLVVAMGASNRKMEALAAPTKTQTALAESVGEGVEQAEELPPDAIWITREQTVAPDQGIPMVEPVPTEETEAARSYTDEDLEVLTRVLTGECQTGSWELQVAVGSVVLNRVQAAEYPDSIKGVVFQRGQYACVRDGNYYRVPTERNRQAAQYLLENGSQIPESVIYQAQFRQGHGVWKKIGHEYFCYR